MLDSLRAFAGGSLWRFGLRTLRRGPAVLVHVLEWMLIAWTMLLALAPTSPWFPSTVVQGAWILFDMLLLVALRALRAQQSAAGTATQRAATRRAAWRLSRALTIAVSANAVLTIAQAAWWNRTSINDRSEWAVILIACLGPMAAAVMLWGTTRRMKTLAR